MFSKPIVRDTGRAGLLILLLLLPGTNARAQAPGNSYINPPGLVKPTGYTHVVVAADRRTLYIAGQVSCDATGTLGPRKSRLAL
jgi:enamine deaminase RidA (YjgF/YER057c/UK114 family)